MIKVFRKWEALPFLILSLICSIIGSSLAGCTKEDNIIYREKAFTIKEIKPLQAMQADTVTLIGIGFDDAVKVLFGKTEAKILSKSETEIKVIVPALENNSDSLAADVPVRIYSPSQYRERNYRMQFLAGTYILDGVKYQVDTIAHYQVGPGTYYTSIDFRHSEFPQRAYFLTMDAEASNLSFKPVLANDVLGNVESVVSMGKRKTAQGKGVYFAGVNADFFNMGGDNRILDGMVLDGKVAALPTEGGVGNMVVMTNGKLLIDELSYVPGQVKLDGTVEYLDDINNMRGTNQLVMYNDLYGLSTKTSDGGTEVVIKPTSGYWTVNSSVEFVVVDVSVNRGNTAIPKGMAVLSAQGTKQDALQKLKVGDRGAFLMNIKGSDYSITNPLHILGVKPIILKNGLPTSYTWDERHPRTSLGLSADRKKMIMCVIDGRQDESKGVTVSQLALIMKRAGAATAFNLDGGGSSTMYVTNAGYNGTGLMNKPVGGTYTRKVANGFFAIADVPEDNQIASIVSRTYVLRMKRGETASLSFYGLNRYGLVVDNDLQDVQITPDKMLGTVAGNNFTASGSLHSGFLTANYQGRTVRVKVLIHQ